jgi:hypothetical protein
MLQGICFSEIENVGSPGGQQVGKVLWEDMLDGGQWPLMAQKLSVGGLYRHFHRHEALFNQLSRREHPLSTRLAVTLKFA